MNICPINNYPSNAYLIFHPPTNTRPPNIFQIEYLTNNDIYEVRPNDTFQYILATFPGEIVLDHRMEGRSKTLSAILLLFSLSSDLQLIHALNALHLKAIGGADRRLSPSFKFKSISRILSGAKKCGISSNAMVKITVRAYRMMR